MCESGFAVLKISSRLRSGYIEEAMKIADYKELFLRIRSIKKEQGALGPQTQEFAV